MIQDEEIEQLIIPESKFIFDKYGISKVTKIVFQDQRQKVRKLSPVGYRLLNFIAYSHLFYANCLMQQQLFSYS